MKLQTGEAFVSKIKYLTRYSLLLKTKVTANEEYFIIQIRFLKNSLRELRMFSLFLAFKSQIIKIKKLKIVGVRI